MREHQEEPGIPREPSPHGFDEPESGPALRVLNRSAGRGLQDLYCDKGEHVCQENRYRCARHPVERAQHGDGRDGENQPSHLHHKERTQSACSSEGKSRPDAERAEDQGECEDPRARRHP